MNCIADFAPVLAPHTGPKQEQTSRTKVGVEHRFLVGAFGILVAFVAVLFVFAASTLNTQNVLTSYDIVTYDMIIYNTHLYYLLIYTLCNISCNNNQYIIIY